MSPRKHAAMRDRDGVARLSSSYQSRTRSDIVA